MNPLYLRFATDIPLIEEGAMRLFVASLLQPQSAEHPAFAELRKRVQPQIEMRSGVAVIPVMGALAQRPHPIEQAFYGIEDTAAIYRLVSEAIANSDVDALLLHLDSPGGFHTGGPEVAEAIARSPKPVVAFSDGLMASLAYLIGSQAHQVVVTRSAITGSIGSMASFTDYSRMLENAGIKVEVFRNAEGRFKAAGVPGTSLDEHQRSAIQDMVQSSFNVFRDLVTCARPHVPDSAMQGQTFSGGEAKKVGLVDRLGDFNFALSVARSLARKQSRTFPVK